TLYGSQGYCLVAQGRIRSAQRMSARFSPLIRVLCCRGAPVRKAVGSQHPKCWLLTADDRPQFALLVGGAGDELNVGEGGGGCPGVTLQGGRTRCRVSPSAAAARRRDSDGWQRHRSVHLMRVRPCFGVLERRTPEGRSGDSPIGRADEEATFSGGEL